MPCEAYWAFCNNFQSPKLGHSLIDALILHIMQHIRPWPNGLASRDTSSGLAFRLATHLRRLASTCHDYLRGLALSLVELKFTQVDASF